MPIKNQMEIMLLASIYQKIVYQKTMFSMKKIIVTTAAQKRGLWYRGTSPTDGTFVNPYTKPVNCPSGMGFVARLTTTVTVTQTTKDQSAWYISWARPLAWGESAT